MLCLMYFKYLKFKEIIFFQEFYCWLFFLNYCFVQKVKGEVLKVLGVRKKVNVF